MSIRHGGAFAVALALSLVAVACGDDSSSDTTSTASAAAETPTSAAADTTAAPAAAPTGTPIVLSVIGQSTGPVAQPEVYDAAKAAAQAINDAGGVKDPKGGASSPVEILTCDGALSVDPNSPLKCAREAVDKGALASVGKYSSGDDIYTEFEKVGLPVIGQIALSAGDFTHELSFPLQPGSAGIVAGLGALAQAAGHEKVVLITNDLPSGRVLPDFIKPFLKSPDDLINSIFLPLDPSSDISALIAQATSADAVLMANSAAGNVRVISALTQAGYAGPVAVAGTSVNSDVLNEIGDAADRLIISAGEDSVHNTSNPVIAEFRADIEKYAPDTVLSEFSLNAWLAVKFTAGVLAESGFDRAALVQALNGRQVSTGVNPDFVMTDSTNPLKLNRLFTLAVQSQVVKDGLVVPAGDGTFVDLTKLPG